MAQILHLQRGETTVIRELAARCFTRLVSFVILTSYLCCVSCTHHKREHEPTKHELSEKARDEELSVACKYETVYVCVSPTARRYHSDPDCSGLSNCTHHVEEMTVAEAEEMGKTPCRRCNY